MLYTRKGDTGNTGLFGSKQRVSKSSAITEALGSLDEINSFLGLAKVKSEATNFAVGEKAFPAIVHQVQQNLFIIQAELAGSDMTISEDKLKEIEDNIGAIEALLPPITSFFISGGTELGATFDVARTIARRAERRVVAAIEEGERKIGEHSRAYLNRLSSLLYALARLSNHYSGITEQSPTYK